ncbi:MAG: hypothetical protein WBA25_12740, partial [Jannaschia sp.]
MAPIRSLGTAPVNGHNRAMSKSLKRVAAALDALGLAARPVEMPGETRTAVQAAAAVGCTLD